MEGSYTAMYISINIYNTFIYSDLKKRIRLLHQADHIYIPWDELFGFFTYAILIGLLENLNQK